LALTHLFRRKIVQYVGVQDKLKTFSKWSESLQDLLPLNVPLKLRSVPALTEVLDKALSKMLDIHCRILLGILGQGLSLDEMAIDLNFSVRAATWLFT
jgi:hypothetical protein